MTQGAMATQEQALQQPAGSEARQDTQRSNEGREQTIREKVARSGSADDRRPSAASRPRRARWAMGMLNDPETDEVPGSVLLLSKVSEFNEPLGMRNMPARMSASSIPSTLSRPTAQRTWSHSSSIFRRRSAIPEKKRTPDGRFVLDPQPDDSLNDPLNWSIWRRDSALISLGFYCMVGGGMTPVLAAGFNSVATEYNVTVPDVALTTGLYMLGLGLGSVFLAPTAILYGKRPVYLVASVCFVLSAIWCALSPNFISLVFARIFMGFAVSSVECLPSATVAEIYFLHEKAYRLGIYTLLLLGGKNLVPLVSAAIIEELGWRWVFWIVAIVVGFAACLLFLFVPETFWDRAPVPPRPRSSWAHAMRSHAHDAEERPATSALTDSEPGSKEKATPKRAHFDNETSSECSEEGTPEKVASRASPDQERRDGDPRQHSTAAPHLTSSNPSAQGNITTDPATVEAQASPTTTQHASFAPGTQSPPKTTSSYTSHFASQPPKTFYQSLWPMPGRLSSDNWFRVALRPFILFAYPSILWSTLVYSLSIGWLIVLSESVSTIYQNRHTYHFNPLQTGLVYISPFVGGILGTAVAGKVSDYIVRYMARQNGGVYEPEFRLIMALPITISTVIGLMGYGWSAEERDNWIVPTFFFGLISFGCALGSTTSITFAVDSYRTLAEEALVTLNFSKNILHGLVFSLFFNKWLDDDGSKTVFVAIGGIQLACLLTTIPMYIYGKRARMWTVRKGMMERF